jgi:hypothetical protein
LRKFKKHACEYSSRCFQQSRLFLFLLFKSLHMLTFPIGGTFKSVSFLGTRGCSNIVNVFPTTFSSQFIQIILLSKDVNMP